MWILWRRLDTPGHDACRLRRLANGWEVDGTAVYRENGIPACLSYSMQCDSEWRTVRGNVRGWLGDQSVDCSVERSIAGAWTLNGTAMAGLESCVDLDLGFTPATNLSQLRRVALRVGEAADVPVAWLDVSAGTLRVLPQRYERRSRSTCWYEAPGENYEGLLEVGAAGFIHLYPGLWQTDL